MASYIYDKSGNRAAETDAIGNRTDHTFTARNLLDTTSYPLTTPADSCPAVSTRATRSYTYDGVGNLQTEVDEAGTTTNYGYDKENRRNSVAFAGETTLTSYTFFGKPALINRPLNNGRSLKYDGFRLLTSVTEGPIINGAIAKDKSLTIITSYDYDANGNQLNQYAPGGVQTEYKYD